MSLIKLKMNFGISVLLVFSSNSLSFILLIKLSKFLLERIKAESMTYLSSTILTLFSEILSSLFRLTPERINIKNKI